MPDSSQPITQQTPQGRRRGHGEAALISVFVLLLLLPTAQMTFKPFRLVPLNGAEIRPERPAFSWHSFISGEFQKQFDDWFSTVLGFRGHLVRSDNQLNFSLFRELSSASCWKRTIWRVLTASICCRRTSLPSAPLSSRDYKMRCKSAASLFCSSSRPANLKPILNMCRRTMFAPNGGR